MADGDVFDIPPGGFSLYGGQVETPAFDVGNYTLGAASPSGGGSSWFDSFLAGLKNVKDFTLGPTGDKKDYGALGTLGDVAKAALPIAGIGTSIMGAIQSRDVAQQIANQSKTASQAQKTQIRSAEQGQELAPKAAALSPEIAALAPRFGDLSRSVETRVAGPQIDYGNRLLAMASAGTLDPADAAQIEEWKTKRISEWQDFLSRSGQGDSSTLQDKVAQVEREAASMRAQILAGYRTTAQQYLQGGGAGLGEAATLTQAEGGDLALAAQPLGVAGSILAGSAGAAGAAGASAVSQEQSLEQLIAATEAQLKRLSASTA